MTPRPTCALPVYLLTGFLGSGKTTLLSALVRQSEFADTAVIVNEFGAVALDHVLMDHSAGGDVVVLDSGCLCCASNSPLQDSLESLYYRRLRGEVPAFARVVVETSGLADPLPLINALAADPSVAQHYEFAGVITTLDAVNGPATLNTYQESAVQLAVADRVVLTKTDLVDAAKAQQVQALVQATNPQADLLIAPPPGHPAPDVLRGLVRHSHTLPESPALAMSPLGHLLRYGITSHIVRVAQPVSWGAYAAWVRLLQRQWGERLLRAKGILDFEDQQTYAVHGVRHLFAAPAPLKGAVPATQRGSLVLITSHVGRDEVAQATALLHQAVGSD
jgi:G3E family GTPase